VVKETDVYAHAQGGHFERLFWQCLLLVLWLH